MELERKGGEQAGRKERGRRVGWWVGRRGRSEKEAKGGRNGGREGRREKNFQKSEGYLVNLP